MLGNLSSLPIEVHSLTSSQNKISTPAPQKRQVNCSISTKNRHPDSTRRSANYQPAIWSYSFVQSLQINHRDDKYEDKAKELDEEVRCLIKKEDADQLVILELIYDIQRLGLGYRFEDEIKGALDRIFSWNEDEVDAGNKLHAAALKFMLLRKHGYDTSQDVFKTFIDQEGYFMACYKTEVKGMLSLYEAAYLGFDGEDILNKALSFSRTHLNELQKDIKPGMLELVNHALELPLHHRVPRQEARWYIESYGNKRNSNHLLLELAKLDFNRVQSIHKDDLKDVSRWWEEIGLAKKLKFARDRLTESFVWSVAIVPEPLFSDFRINFTKIAVFITVLDDIYDIYGTLDELELFTDAVKRWDVNAVEDFPDYLKLFFLALYNTVNEMAYHTYRIHGGQIIIPYLKKAWTDLCKSFLQEAKWSYNNRFPKFEEYLNNGTISSSVGLMLVHSYFLLSESFTEDALMSLEKYHNLIRWPSIIFRLCNDLVSSKAESERGETTNSISCYMHETGLSEDVIRQQLKNIIDSCWKKMNREKFERQHPFNELFVEAACNLGRMAECTYQYSDGYGAPDARAKKGVESLVFDPIN